jgi:hypothetical protein
MSISTPRVKPVPRGPVRVATAVRVKPPRFSGLLTAAFGLVVVWCAFWIGVGLLLMELVR